MLILNIKIHIEFTPYLFLHMTIHLYRTFTPSTWNATIDSQVKSNTWNNLIYKQHHCGKGCNTREIIIARHKRGGHKCLYRKINFQWNGKYIYGKIITIEYHPNGNAYICLIHYGDTIIFLYPKGAIIIDTIIFLYRSSYKNRKCPTFECCLNYWFM